MKQKRNSKCNCGSGKKYKKCCQITEYEERIEEEKRLYDDFMKKIEGSDKNHLRTKLLLATMLDAGRRSR